MTAKKTPTRRGTPVHFWTQCDKEAWQAFAEKYGQTLGECIEAAMLRHMAFPPPLPEPAPFVPKRPVGRPKKNS